MIINLTDNYFVEVDEYNYTLKQDTGKVDKKGRPVHNVVGYFSSLSASLRRFAEVSVINSNDHVTIREYADRIDKKLKEIERMVEE